MRRWRAIAVLLLAANSAAAQQIPGRDLFDFPLGSVAEGAALSLVSADGFRNPASILVPAGNRGRFSVSSLLTGTQQGVTGQLVSAAMALRGTTFGLSFARASVNGIARTDTDPQSLGGDVPYNAMALSALVGRRPSRDLSAGVAVRLLRGELDLSSRTELGFDGGVVYEHLTPVDLRLAASSFFWRPGSHSGDGATFSGSADLRAVGKTEARTLRAGYAYSSTPGISVEQYAFTSARLQNWEVRTGLARSSAFSHASLRWRFAVGVHVDRYFAAIAREDNPSGLAASYQFTLTSLVPRP